MNVGSLETFKQEVNQIREYLRHIQYVNEVMAYNILETDNEKIKKLLSILNDHYKYFKTHKRIFEYKTLIISIYGLLEKYIEMWIKEYLESLCSIVPEYNQIDEKIRDNHFELSLKLINSIVGRENAKFQHLTKEEVLKKLYECIVKPTNYKINTEAFVTLSGNLKHNKIIELFKFLQIDMNDKLKNNEILRKHIEKEQQIGNIHNLKTETLYNKINDIVERRNVIAHGGIIDDILDSSILESYISFLEQYCQAIYETLLENLIMQESIHTFQKIENVIKIFNNKILAFEIEKYTIKLGDMLIIETKEGKFYKKPIIEIQLDHQSYTELTITEKTKITVSVDHKIKANQNFFIKSI